MPTLGHLNFRPQGELREQNFTVVEQAIADMRSAGLYLPALATTSYRGEMPLSLTGMTDDALGDLLNSINQWCGYIEEQLAIAEARWKEADANYDFIQARVRLEASHMSERKLTNDERKDLTEVDPRVKQARETLIYTETAYRYTSAILNRNRKDWETISRRITQRGQEIERMRREQNVAGIPVVQRAFARR